MNRCGIAIVLLAQLPPVAASVAFAGPSLAPAAAAPSSTPTTLPTRLYVKTVPSGSRVWVDGVRAGDSDVLLVVTPGRHAVRVDRDGYAIAAPIVDARPERITRLELALERLPAAAEAASHFLGRAEDLPAEVREAGLLAIREAPGQTQWSGQAGGMLHAVAVRKLPQEPARTPATPGVISATDKFAVAELLTAKSLLDTYATVGLSDVAALREAVLRAVGDLEVSGRATAVTRQAAAEGDYAVAIAVARPADVTAHLSRKPEMDKVRIAYRDVVHERAQGLMKAGRWAQALEVWQHLHRHKLVSQSLYVDAAACFHELRQDQDALKVLSEAMKAFEPTATPKFLAAAGDLALKIGTPEAEKLAEQAYRAASAKLGNTVTADANAPEPLPQEP